MDIHYALADIQQFVVSEGIIGNRNFLLIRFPYDQHKINWIKANYPVKWSAIERAWYLPDLPRFRTLIGLPPRTLGKQALAKIHPINLEALSKLQVHLRLKSYAPSTLRTYSIEFAQLLYLIKDFPVVKLSPEQLQSYFLYCVNELKLSEHQIHSRMNAIKFYFEQVLHQKSLFFDIPRPKKPLQLPKALNTKEVKKLIMLTENPKHKLILQLTYGMGLRVSEVVNLKLADIDSHSMHVLVERSKGKKDRYVNLPQSILESLRAYYLAFKPKHFLFEGQDGIQYSVRSAQQVFAKAMQRAGIRKKVGIHGLRHSYATHLLQQGTDISYIKDLLGHNDVKTTLIYAKVAPKALANIKSPLDSLDL